MIRNSCPSRSSPRIHLFFLLIVVNVEACENRRDCRNTSGGPNICCSRGGVDAVAHGYRLLEGESKDFSESHQRDDGTNHFRRLRLVCNVSVVETRKHLGNISEAYCVTAVAELFCRGNGRQVVMAHHFRVTSNSKLTWLNNLPKRAVISINHIAESPNFVGLSPDSCPLNTYGSNRFEAWPRTELVHH